MVEIKHLFHIDAPRERVYEAISTINGLSNWWTKETTGNSNIGGEIEFRFGKQWANKMKVLELKENSLVKWVCKHGADDWIGTNIIFHLDDNEGKTRVRFDHIGWKENGDFYAMCNFSWGRYMESLRKLWQTGKGEAFGSDNFRT